MFLKKEPVCSNGGTSLKKVWTPYNLLLSIFQNLQNRSKHGYTYFVTIDKCTYFQNFFRSDSGSIIISLKAVVSGYHMKEVWHTYLTRSRYSIPKSFACLFWELVSTGLYLEHIFSFFKLGLLWVLTTLNQNRHQLSWHPWCPSGQPLWLCRRTCLSAHWGGPPSGFHSPSELVRNSRAGTAEGGLSFRWQRADSSAK